MILSLFWHQKAVAPDLLSLPPSPQKTTLLAVGDVMLSRNVGAKIDASGNVNLPFEKVHDLLDSADITFGNLECPLSDSQIPIREGLVFRCLTKYVPGLTNTGFDVMSTANNHSFDQGQKQIGFTVDYLKSQNILPVGTGKDFEEAHNGAIITTPSQPARLASRLEAGGSPPPFRQGGEGVRFGFLSYSYSARNDGKNTTDPQIATLDPDQLAKDIKSIKDRGADVVIVSMHAGTEYTRHPNQEQIDFAHAAIDVGADVVLGHHPHWVQDIEIYPPLSPPASVGGEKEGVHRGLILYSLGNFVFDQSWSQNTREGLAVELTFTNDNLAQAKLIPVVIENNCCPRAADEKEKTNILRKIDRDSDIIQF